ncbi:MULTISPECIES: hypothetical protein [unclassified Nostoc]|uniref:hypothetical protein n=1 Tax=unclassified Nostoc TaxID=2593658 RepID=UPI00167EAA7D|nr:hypothetical protein [Nostoc sp. 'Peltigera membranacea cyanobiont' 213]
MPTPHDETSNKGRMSRVDLAMVMLINHTVIQNFDSSELQANGHHKFKQRR